MNHEKDLTMKEAPTQENQCKECGNCLEYSLDLDLSVGLLKAFEICPGCSYCGYVEISIDDFSQAEISRIIATKK